MSIRVWVNGVIGDAEDALVSPFDRGFMFGDGVYETILFFNAVGVGMDAHIARLARSMEAAGIRGFDATLIDGIGQTLLREAGLRDAVYYVQVTRGVQMPRRHLPPEHLPPTVFAYVEPGPSLASMSAPKALRAALLPDQRWHRCEIKTTSLLANVMAAMDAKARGADEAILHRQGLVSEGAMTNLFVVADGTLATPRAGDDPAILHGVTRRMTLEAAGDLGLAVEERPVPTEELLAADEVFLTSSRRLVDAIVSIDGAAVGSGNVGPTTATIFDRVRHEVAVACGIPGDGSCGSGRSDA